MSWAVLARALLLAVLLLLDAGRRGHAASHDGQPPVAELTWWRQVAEEPSVKNSGSATPRSGGSSKQPSSSGGSDDVMAVAEVGKPGKIVLLSPGQLLNDTGAYRVSGDERVRKAAGFEIAYDYYFKPQDPSVPNNNFKSMTKKSMPLILATSFLIILIVCIAVCISGICWERTRRLVASRISPSGPVEPPDLTPRNAAAGDSGVSAYGNDKYMI
ncbi:uncharacterized protein [Dermacentor albipictus]|uniref:uncharacterized protein n=1 Tax=Dermacentor albipictus TaxID=60249 RepID=UPI0038FC126F